MSANKCNHFLGVTSMMPEDLVAEWEQLSDEPEFKNGEWTSVYRHKQVKGELVLTAGMLPC